MWNRERKDNVIQGHEPRNEDSINSETGKERFSPRTSKRNQPCWPFDINPLRLILQFWPPELYKNKFVLF